MNFSYCDRLIADMNRRNLRMFDRLKQLKFDELNILQSVKSVYERSIRLAKQRYLQIAHEAYLQALIECGVRREEAKRRADEDIVEDYIIEMLDDDNPTTLYRFLPEADRKRERLVEALSVTSKPSEEVDKALRYWTLQISQYSDQCVVDATIKAYLDAGIKEVMWVAVDDLKTCKYCVQKNGEIYPINDIPPRQHYHCRCVLIPLF